MALNTHVSAITIITRGIAMFVAPDCCRLAFTPELRCVRGPGVLH